MKAKFIQGTLRPRESWKHDYFPHMKVHQGAAGVQLARQEHQLALAEMVSPITFVNIDTPTLKLRITTIDGEAMEIVGLKLK